MKRMLAVLTAALLMQQSVSAAPQPDFAPLYEASFLQSWYCRGWTESQWQSELSDMKAAGFRAVILQSSVDLTYEQIVQVPAQQNSVSSLKTDPNLYELTSAESLYSSELAPSADSPHALEYALEAAKSTDMQVYIGTVSDNRWWNYGWGVPEIEFTWWSEINAAQCSTVIREIWEQFGETYGAQIAGFYYNNEIWNMDAACAGTDDGKTAEILGSNIRASLSQIETLCPEKPLMLSPFYNTDLSSPEAYGAFWCDIAEAAQLRSCDIFACQDGGGRDYPAETVREWISALQSALGGKLRYWVNQETFSPDYSTKSTDALRKNYLAAPLAERHILFSWNHYFHGKLDANYLNLLQQMTCDINGDGLFDANDAKLLSNRLTDGRTGIANWRAGDLDEDGILNAADLSLLKQRLKS